MSYNMKNFSTIVYLLLISAVALFAGETDNPYISRVYEYVPAPGQFTNLMPEWEDGDDAEAILNKVNERLCGVDGSLVCLGAWGGYVTFGFDHPIVNLPDSCDLALLGNAFYSKIDEQGRQQGSAEPGIVYVSRDDNNNGMPDDTWYEIAGSEYSRSRQHYSITYRRPTNDTLNVTGTDMDGNTITVYHNAFHPQAYYPKWLGSRYTLTGTLLPTNVLQDATYSWLVFDYGYADNHPNGHPAGFIDIDWAVDENGEPAQLESIDFVRVQTGVSANSGNKGETSTEISGAQDLHPQAALRLTQHEAYKQCCKIIYNGHVIIQKNGIEYNILGHTIK